MIDFEFRAFHKHDKEVKELPKSVMIITNAVRLNVFTPQPLRLEGYLSLQAAVRQCLTPCGGDVAS